MLAAYRPLMRSSSGLCLSTLTDGISMYVKQEEYVYFSQISDNHNFHASTSNNHESLSIRYNNPLRRNDNIHKQYLRRISSDGTRRKLLLKAGRARRKMQLKQSTHKKSATSKHDERNNSATPPEEKLLNSNIDDDYHEKKSVSPKDILFGVPMDNPLRERYIRSQQKINYPKTWSGWKEVFRKTKDTYLWTFEGFLLPEKKRDEHGNIIPDNEDDADEEDVDKNTTIKDKARDAANQMAGNLQNNISTIQQEAPKLLRMGQEVTGISSREELRAWVGEQLKLGTACLTEFMKGYRSGRDDEVDKMLHEYFKDLDEEKNETSAVGEERNEADANTGDIHTRSPKRERRSWGRNERRRTKAMSSTTRATSLSINE
jgi:hypothetical protein